MKYLPIILILFLFGCPSPTPPTDPNVCDTIIYHYQDSVIFKDSVVISYKDSTVLNYRDSLIINIKDSTVINYDTVIVYDTVYVKPKPDPQVRAVLKLEDGTFINNAPSGRNWTEYNVSGFSLSEVTEENAIIDDSEIEKLTYYGNWKISDTLAVPKQEGNCYCSWAGNSTDSIVVKFTRATGFAWIGEKMQHHGIAYVYLNNEFQEKVDTYQQNNQRLTVNWEINGLDTAQVYSFKIVVGGEKNPASSGTNVVMQQFALKNIK